MSRTVVFDSYGAAEVLHVIDVDPPEPGPGQIRVEVRAAGVQPFDALFRRGAAQQWLPARFPQRLGNEFAGVVDAVGSGVATFTVGAEVLGWAMLTSYAEHVVVGAGDVVPKPAAMPWTEAGVVSASGQTAWSALRQLRIDGSDTLLVHAAAGGVGSFAVQLARARGAVVIGTASERNHGYLRTLGAIPVAYGDGLVDRVRAAAPDGVDVALDASGTVEALRASLDLVGSPERVGTVAFQPAAAELGIRRLSTERSAEQLRELTGLYAAGALRVTIDRAYPLAEAASAHRAIETGHARGKIVLVP
ncbi:NADP-dependent oxidoreductase [Plantactinospora solaniradicis]|uniref:NADP-dependent oxidoreductase n=1 Tax=Plantactinospora solaniradicis TaxID=1723736 RepID=A0ABW1KF10_9ACTN